MPKDPRPDLGNPGRLLNRMMNRAKFWAKKGAGTSLASSAGVEMSDVETWENEGGGIVQRDDVPPEGTETPA